MKYIFAFICVTLFFSCGIKPNEYRVTADLTFQSISLTTFDGGTEEQYKKIREEVANALANPEKHKNSIELHRFVAQLDKHNILEAPKIHLYVAKDSMIGVYLSNEAYEKVKRFKYIDLYKAKKKVIVELDIIQKEKHIFYADKIYSVKKVEGVTKRDGRVLQLMN